MKTFSKNKGKKMILLKVIKVRNSWFVPIVFFYSGFKFKDFACSGCHGLVMSCVNIRDIIIITVKNVGHCCIIHNISKSEAINLLESAVLENDGYI